MKNKKMIYQLLSFTIPIFILSIIYIVIGIAPFGRESLLTIDMHNQYISYYAHWKSVLSGESGFFYSFSNGFGGEMVGLSAYYLMSPFNLLIVFFSIENLPFFILTISLLKVAMMGTTMFYYLEKKNTLYVSLLFAVVYSMIGYSIVYQQNLMWVDSLIYLPLVILGIEEIIYGKKSKVYIIALSLSIYSNYYIGFMISIFSVIYLLVKTAEIYPITKYSNIKKFIPILKIFIVESLLVGGLLAALLLPLAFSFEGGRSGFNIAGVNILSHTFSFKDILSKFYLGAFNYNEIVSGLPNIYTSLIFFPLFIVMFLSTNFSRKERISVVVLLLLLLLSFYFEGINLFWHGLKPPVWFPYRYSFLFSTVIVIYSANILNKILDGKITISFFSTIVIIFMFLGITLWVSTSEYEYLDNKLVWLSFGIVTIYSFILAKKQMNRYMKTILFIIILIEVALNGVKTLNELNYVPLTEYTNYINTNKSIISKYRNEKEFYRIEKNYGFNANDQMLLNYNGISHYSSTSKVSDISFLGALGYREYGSWAKYGNGSSIESDSLLGIRYLLFDKPQSSYTFVEKIDGIYVYENKNYLPLGIVVNGKTNLGKLQYSNPLENINQIYNSLGATSSVLEKIDNKKVAVELDNTDYMNVHNGLNRYGKIDINKKSLINFQIPNPENDTIEFYFDIEHSDDADIYVNSKYLTEGFTSQTNSVNIADSESQLTEITIELKNQQLRYWKQYFYKRNQDIFESTISKLKNNSMKINEIEDGHIKGTVTSLNNDSSLLLSIPYYSGWEAKVNNKEVKIKEAFGGLSEIDLPNKGEFTVEITYKHKGIVSGSIISLISIVLTLVYYKKDNEKL